MRFLSGCEGRLRVGGGRSAVWVGSGVDGWRGGGLKGGEVMMTAGSGDRGAGSRDGRGMRVSHGEEPCDFLGKNHRVMLCCGVRRRGCMEVGIAFIHSKS